MGLDSVELVMAFEEAFEVAIPPAQAATIVTIGDATDVIAALRQADGRPLDRANVRALVCSITGDHTATRLDRLTEDTRFIDDLGLS